MKAVLAQCLRCLVEMDFVSRSREVRTRSLGKGRSMKRDFNLAEVPWQTPIGLKVGHAAIRREG